MINQEELKIMANKVLEMLYCLYQKEIKAGSTKDNLIPYFGKIIKKKDAGKRKDEPNLFGY